MNDLIESQRKGNVKVRIVYSGKRVFDVPLISNGNAVQEGPLIRYVFPWWSQPLEPCQVILLVMFHFTYKTRKLSTYMFIQKATEIGVKWVDPSSAPSH